MLRAHGSIKKSARWRGAVDGVNRAGACACRGTRQLADEEVERVLMLGEDEQPLVPA
jgi:hypothetical protein